MTNTPAAIQPPADKVNAVSIHEAGHAVIALVLRRPISVATIQRDGHSAGFVELSDRRPMRVFRETANGTFVNVEQDKRRTLYRTEICFLLAGRAAEELLLPDLAIQDSDVLDRNRIAEILPRALSPGQSEAQLLETPEQRTRKLVRTYRDVILLLAGLLVSNTSLTGAQIQLVCRTPIRIARENARAVERLKKERVR
jgi:ATP-dependent Zn protease